jgi:ABC-type nitrate/sulfonate/bicarbonate transport system permease component
VTTAARIARAGRGAGELTHRVSLAPAAAALGVLAGTWELIGRIADVPFFPPLTTVLVRLGEMIGDGLIIENLATSLTNLVLGFTVSLAIALVVGLLMGAFAKVEAALDVYVNALLTAPSLVFAPIFFSIWGLGRESIIAVVVMYSCFIMIINTAAGVRTVPRPLVEMGTSFSATRWQLFRFVVLPAATPLIMAGVRLGVGRAVKGMINGEMFIAVVGLGKLVQDAGRQLDAASVLAVLIVIVVVAFVSVAVVQAIDNRLTSWLPTTARSR